MSEKLHGSAGVEALTEGFCWLFKHLRNTLDGSQGKQLDIWVYFCLHEIVNMPLGQTLLSLPPEKTGNKLFVKSYTTLENGTAFSLVSKTFSYRVLWFSILCIKLVSEFQATLAEKWWKVSGLVLIQQK